MINYNIKLQNSLRLFSEIRKRTGSPLPVRSYFSLIRLCVFICPRRCAEIIESSDKI